MFSGNQQRYQSAKMQMAKTEMLCARHGIELFCTYVIAAIFICVFSCIFWLHASHISTLASICGRYHLFLQQARQNTRQLKTKARGTHKKLVSISKTQSEWWNCLINNEWSRLLNDVATLADWSQGGAFVNRTERSHTHTLAVEDVLAHQDIPNKYTKATMIDYTGAVYRCHTRSLLTEELCRRSAHAWLTSFCSTVSWSADQMPWST